MKMCILSLSLSLSLSVFLSILRLSHFFFFPKTFGKGSGNGPNYHDANGQAHAHRVALVSGFKQHTEGPPGYVDQVRVGQRKELCVKKEKKKMKRRERGGCVCV